MCANATMIETIKSYIHRSANKKWCNLRQENCQLFLLLRSIALNMKWKQIEFSLCLNACILKMVDVVMPEVYLKQCVVHVHSVHNIATDSLHTLHFIASSALCLAGNAFVAFLTSEKLIFFETFYLIHVHISIFAFNVQHCMSVAIDFERVQSLDCAVMQQFS